MAKRVSPRSSIDKNSGSGGQTLFERGAGGVASRVGGIGGNSLPSVPKVKSVKAVDPDAKFKKMTKRQLLKDGSRTARQEIAKRDAARRKVLSEVGLWVRKQPDGNNRFF